MEAKDSLSAAHDPDSGEQRIGMVLRRAEQALLRAKSAALKPAGLTLAQFVALEELERRPGVTGSALARACLVTPQAMQVVLKALEEQGMVGRAPHPRHLHIFELQVTVSGAEAIAAAREAVAPVERQVFDRFSASELRTLARLLNRLGEAVGG